MKSIGTELGVHIASLRRYACALLRNRIDADDLVQETLMRALSRAEQFTPGTNLRAWLFTILHNLHVNQVRQQAGRAGDVLVEDVDALLAVPERQEGAVALSEMMKILATLPEDQRRVLLLVGMEGLKYDEVARTLGIPIGTVMSRLSRAREAMRVRMGEPAVTGTRRVK